MTDLSKTYTTKEFKGRLDVAQDSSCLCCLQL